MSATDVPYQHIYFLCIVILAAEHGKQGTVNEHSPFQKSSWLLREGVNGRDNRGEREERYEKGSEGYWGKRGDNKEREREKVTSMLLTPTMIFWHVARATCFTPIYERRWAVVVVRGGVLAITRAALSFGEERWHLPSPVVAIKTPRHSDNNTMPSSWEPEAQRSSV